MEVLLYFALPMGLVVSCIATIVLLLAWIGKSIKRKEVKKVKRRCLVSLACSFVLFAAIGLTAPDTSNADEIVEQHPEEAVEPVDEPAEEPALALEFLDGFTEYGYSAEQIEEMRTLLVNVGITEITELEIQPVVYGMQNVKGIAFKDTSFGGGMKEVRVMFTIENGRIIIVNIYCPSFMHENQTPYLNGLEDRRAYLYYDTEGGYLKKIDWENRVVIDY